MLPFRMIFVGSARDESHMKNVPLEGFAFFALLVGALSAWHWSPPFWSGYGFWVLLSLWGLIWLRAKRFRAVLIPLALLLGVAAVARAGDRLQRRQPDAAWADRPLLLRGRVVHQRATPFGERLVLDRVQVLRPLVPFRLTRLVVYVPVKPPANLVRPTLRAWVRLRAVVPPRTIPHPMAALQQRHLPPWQGRVKSTLLMRYQGGRTRLIASDQLNLANRELVGLFAANSAAPLWRERLGWTGLGHLLSISGLHCGLFWLLLRLGLTPVRAPVVRLVLGCLGLLAFAAQMRWGDSVVRAVLFLVVFQVLGAGGRRRSWLRVWAGTAAIWLLLAPEALLRPGFWYTFAVSLGLVVGIGPRRPPSPLEHPWSPRLTGMRALIAAQLFALPVGLLFGPRLNWAAFVWNLSALPVLVLLLMLFVLACVGRWSASAAQLANTVDGWFEGGLLWLRQSEGWGCEVRFPWSVAAVLVALTLLFIVLRRGGRERRWLLCALLVAGGRGLGRPWQGDRLLVLDVGQGSCALLTTAAGDGWFIDAGGRLPAGIQWRHVLRLYGVKRLRGGLVSHFNRDHYGFLETTPVAVPVWVPQRRINEFYGANAPAGVVWQGVDVGTKAGFGVFQLAVIWPPANYQGGNANEESLVLLVTTPAGQVLFPGDAGTLTEPAWAPAARPGHRMLIAGHHGSHSATGAFLLKRFQPHAAVFSCGVDNAFGHPHPRVTARLTSAGVVFHSTATQGTMVLWERASDGLIGKWL